MLHTAVSRTTRREMDRRRNVSTDPTLSPVIYGKLMQTRTSLSSRISMFPQFEKCLFKFCRYDKASLSKSSVTQFLVPFGRMIH